LEHANEVIRLVNIINSERNTAVTVQGLGDVMGSSVRRVHADGAAARAPAAVRRAGGRLSAGSVRVWLLCARAPVPGAGRGSGGGGVPWRF